MDTNVIISQMIILFLILTLGYFIFKIKLVDDNFTKQFSALVIKVTMPALLLSSVLDITERQPLRDVLTSFGIAVALFFIVMPIVGFLLAKLFRVKRNSTGLYVFMATFSNVGFMGFPVISALAGEVGLFYAAIYNLVFNVAVFTLGVWLVNHDKDGESSGFDIKLLMSPGVIAALLAIALYSMNIKLPVLLCDAIGSVGSITSPSAMLIIGCTLAIMDVKTVFSDWRLYPWILIKQIVIPILLWIPLAMIIKNEILLTVTFILFLMPVANNAVLFANTYNGDAELAARSVFLTTLLSLLTVPICVWAIQFI